MKGMQGSSGPKRKKRSRFTARRYVTRPEYIKVWKSSFEFDNFSCAEICECTKRASGRQGPFFGCRD